MGLILLCIGLAEGLLLALLTPPNCFNYTFIVFCIISISRAFIIGIMYSVALGKIKPTVTLAGRQTLVG